MNGLLALSRGIDRVNTVIGRSAAWLILLAIFVSAINAVVRKVLSVSSNAYLELQWYLYGAAFLLAAAGWITRPILERSGLVKVSTTTPYVWTR